MGLGFGVLNELRSHVFREPPPPNLEQPHPPTTNSSISYLNPKLGRITAIGLFSGVSGKPTSGVQVTQILNLEEHLSPSRGFHSGVSNNPRPRRQIQKPEPVLHIGFKV